MSHSTSRDLFQDPAIRDAFLRLSEAAWRARENAYILGKTKVGCALMTATGEVFAGCNVEHRFRSHDIHAEVNAIGSMAAAGARSIVYLLIVAERERFTPCGACMDWIMQFAAEECLVGFQPSPGAEPTMYSTHQLMPYYPQ